MSAIADDLGIGETREALLDLARTAAYDASLDAFFRHLDSCSEEPVEVPRAIAMISGVFREDVVRLALVLWGVRQAALAAQRHLQLLGGPEAPTEEQIRAAHDAVDLVDNRLRLQRAVFAQYFAREGSN